MTNMGLLSATLLLVTLTQCAAATSKTDALFSADLAREFRITNPGRFEFRQEESDDLVNPPAVNICLIERTGKTHCTPEDNDLVSASVVDLRPGVRGIVVRLNVVGLAHFPHRTLIWTTASGAFRKVAEFSQNGGETKLYSNGALSGVVMNANPVWRGENSFQPEHIDINVYRLRRHGGQRYVKLFGYVTQRRYAVGADYPQSFIGGELPNIKRMLKGD